MIENTGNLLKLNKHLKKYKYNTNHCFIDSNNTIISDSKENLMKFNEYFENKFIDTTDDRIDIKNKPLTELKSIDISMNDIIISLKSFKYNKSHIINIINITRLKILFE